MVSVTSIAPDVNENLAAIISEFPLVVTVEAHYITGGLGSLVAELIAERQLRCELVRCGVKAVCPTVTPEAKPISTPRPSRNLDSDALVKTVIRELALREAS